MDIAKDLLIALVIHSGIESNNFNKKYMKSDYNNGNAITTNYVKLYVIYLV